MKFISITPKNNNASEFIEITNKMPSFVKLYSPTCGHCIAMQASWNSLKNNPALKDYNMAIVEVHADEIKNIKSPAMKVNGGFPTIRKVLKNGKLGKDYNGDRSTADMIKFIKEEFKETLHKGKKSGRSKKIKKGGMRRRSTNGEKSKKTRQRRSKSTKRR